jgi:hypothetical protein
MRNVKFGVGDTVAYFTTGGTYRVVEVTGFGEENGRLVFDGVLVDGVPFIGELDIWGYADDVQKVVDKTSLYR